MAPETRGSHEDAAYDFAAALEAQQRRARDAATPHTSWSEHIEKAVHADATADAMGIPNGSNEGHPITSYKHVTSPLRRAGISGAEADRSLMSYFSGLVRAPLLHLEYSQA